MLQPHPRFIKFSMLNTTSCYRKSIREERFFVALFQFVLSFSGCTAQYLIFGFMVLVVTILFMEIASFWLSAFSRFFLFFLSLSTLSNEEN